MVAAIKCGHCCVDIAEHLSNNTLHIHEVADLEAAQFVASAAQPFYVQFIALLEPQPATLSDLGELAPRKVSW